MSRNGGSVNRRVTHRAIVGNNGGLGDGQGAAQSLVVYTPQYYTTNLCTNPSFEYGIDGWSATDSGSSLGNAEVLVNAQGQVIANQRVSLYGSEALQVTTDGTVPLQGCYGPPGYTPVYTGPIFGSITVSLFGETGTLYVTAVGNPDGITLARHQVTLNGSGWQTVVLNNLLMPPSFLNGSIYILITTAFAQDITFYVDGVQYEPESPAHPFVDGDSPNGVWEGTPGNSVSYQQYQFGFSSILGFHLSGSADFIDTGEVIPFPIIEELAFELTPGVSPLISIANPYAALSDFGIWSLTDPDPAQTYAWWTNSGVNSGQTNYTRPYAMVVPPSNYLVSNGQLAWRRAAYMAVGFSWANVPNGVGQVLTDVQLELAQTQTTTAIQPSSYERPRQLQVIIKPNRLNYITNPAMQVSTSGWTGISGNETLAVDTTQFPGTISYYNNLPYAIGQSMRVTLTNNSSSGAKISVPFLIPGEIYMASFWCLPGSQMIDILGGCGTGAGDIAGLINMADGYGGGPDGYGSGPYGGINPSNLALAQNWVQCSFAFLATSDTGTLEISAEMMTGANFPSYFWVTAVVVEPGDVLNPYFDGNSGPDAMWESGGTAGLSRSYYYNQFQYGQSIVNDTLAANTPLGISYATPLYATVPTQ